MRKFWVIMYFLCIFTIVDSVAAKEVMFQDWKSVCEKQKSMEPKASTIRTCHLSQVITDNKTKAILLLVSVIKRKKLQYPFVIFATPLGIDLNSGLRLVVDKKPLAFLSFNTCTHRGCFAGINLTKQLYQRFRRGKTAQIIYHDGAKKAVKLNVSLLGFSEGGKSLNK